jgi:hypothetical protein
MIMSEDLSLEACRTWAGLPFLVLALRQNLRGLTAKPIETTAGLK